MIVVIVLVDVLNGCVKSIVVVINLKRIVVCCVCDVLVWLYVLLSWYLIIVVVVSDC